MRRLLALIAKWSTTEHGLCFLFIVFAGILAVAPSAIDGAAPFALQAGLTPPPVGATPVINPARSSEYAAAHWARAALYIEEIGNGRGSILWDRSEYTGVPFLAEWETRALSPFSIPIYLFGAKTGLWLSALLKVAIAGGLAFYVARVLGITHPFALLVAITHALSASLVIAPADPVSDAIPWVPLAFLFTERLSLGQLRYWAVASIVMAMMLLSGAPMAVTSIALFFGAFFLVRRNQRDWHSLPGPGLSAGLALVAGAGIAGVQLLPWIEWARLSRAVWTLAEAPGWVAASAPFGPLARLDDINKVRQAAPLHTGLISLLLAGLWLVVRPHTPEGHRRRIDALLMVSGAWIGAAVLLAALQPSLPVLQPILLRAVLAPVPFALGLGGAAAAEAWLQLRPGQSLSAIRYFGLVVAAIVGLMFTSYAVAWAAAASAPRAPIEIVVAAVIVSTFLIVLGVTLVRPWPRFMGYALAAATAFELLLAFVPLQPRTPWDEIVPPRTPLAPDRNAAKSDSDLGLAAPSVRGYSPRAPRRMATFLARAQEDPLLLTRAGVGEFVLSIDDLSGPYAKLRPQLRLVSVTAEGAGQFQYVPGAERTRLLHELQTVSRFSPELLDSNLPPQVEAAADSGAQEGRLGRPLLTRGSNPEEQRINVLQNDPGVLVLAQTYYPDWSATVDGAATGVFAVDGAFQGIELPSGSREVVFRYKPEMFRWGLIVSCCSLSISFLGMAHLLYMRGRNQFFKM